MIRCYLTLAKMPIFILVFNIHTVLGNYSYYHYLVLLLSTDAGMKYPQYIGTSCMLASPVGSVSTAWLVSIQSHSSSKSANAKPRNVYIVSSRSVSVLGVRLPRPQQPHPTRSPRQPSAAAPLIPVGLLRCRTGSFPQCSLGTWL